MVHGLQLNFDFSAFCAAFFCFYFGSNADLRKIWYAAFLCPHNGISQELQRVLRDDPAESQQFHVWVKVSFPSVISHRKLERKSCRWSSSRLEPCWRESDACSLQPWCCTKQTYMFQSDLAGGLGSRPSRSGLSDLVFGRIWGQEERFPFRLSLAAWRFRRCNRTVWNGGLYLFLYFLITRANGLTGDITQNKGVKRQESK